MRTSSKFIEKYIGFIVLCVLLFLCFYFGEHYLNKYTACEKCQKQSKNPLPTVNPKMLDF